MRIARFLGLTAASIMLTASAVACGSSTPAPTTPGGSTEPGASAPAPSGSAPAGGAAAAAVPGPGGQGTPKKGGTFNTSQNGDPPTFDVHATSLGVLTNHTSRTHNRLTRYEYNDKTGSLIVVGDLAEKWEASTDAKTWTFTIRKGVKFHNIAPINGREFTADDVKFSYERIKTAESSIWKGQYDFIDKIDVVDKYTVKFSLKVVNASMLYRTSDGEAAWMVGKEVTQQPNYGKDPKVSLIGTGPFIFDKYDRGVELTEKRNPDYFGTGFTGLPYIDGVNQLVINDAGARLAAFLSKQIDTSGVPVADLEKVKAVAGVRVRENKGSNTDSGIIINTTKAPFDNVKVRQALRYGVNQQAIIDGLYRGAGSWSGFIPNGLTSWTLPESEIKQLYKHDPDQAKKLLTEAGFPNGVSGELLVFTGYQQNYIDTAEVMINDLKKSGFNITMKLDQLAAGRKAVEDGNFTLNNSAHITGLEPDEFAKDGVVPTGSRNFFRINDPKLIELAAKQTSIVNVAERKKVVDEIHKYVAEIALIVPIPTQWSYSAVHGYVKNYFPDNIAGDECSEQFFWLEK